MSGVAARARLPEQWSATEHVKWSVPVAGSGWSSPIVWGDTVYLTTAIGTKQFKAPSSGLFGNDDVAVAWMQPRASGYTPSALLHAGKAFLVHDTGILTVLDAKTGKQVYKVRVGGGGTPFRPHRSPPAPASTSSARTASPSSSTPGTATKKSRRTRSTR